MSITENVHEVRRRIDEAARKAGRKPEEITLCAATKMNDSDAVREAIAAGVDCCGENRVQELVKKQADNAYIGAPVHFIGHLQTNKLKQVVGKVDLIQSIGSMHLLEAVNKEAEKQGICQDILIEVNIGREEQKSGFLPEALDEALIFAGKMHGIHVKGLMTVPPVSENSMENLKILQKMCNLTVDIRAKKYHNIEVSILSMGMSGDFEDAIACGATMVRIGTTIFGPRNYNI